MAKKNETTKVKAHLLGAVNGQESEITLVDG
jgi:hypothetical protein